MGSTSVVLKVAIMITEMQQRKTNHHPELWSPLDAPDAKNDLM